MSSKNKVKLKRQISRCEAQTQKLLQEKVNDRWSEISEIMELEKETAEAELTKQNVCNLIETSKSEKELEDLKEKIKFEEEYESALKQTLEFRQAHFVEHKKFMKSAIRKLEQRADEIDRIIYSDKSGIVGELNQRRKELEERLTDLDDFCTAVCSILESMESKKHI